jgi:ribosome modulation factor
MSDRDAKVVRIPRDTKARREGYFAGRRGRNDADNPYNAETRRARDWTRGLLDGRQRQLTIVRSD